MKYTNLIDSYFINKASKDGRHWYVAKPEPKLLRDRLKGAWMVMQGKADAVTFYEQE